MSLVINQLTNDRAEIREIEILGQGSFVFCRNACGNGGQCICQATLFDCFDAKVGLVTNKEPFWR